jgi:transposase
LIREALGSLENPMKIVASQIGVDVSKDELVVSIDGGKPLCFANTPAGGLALLELLPTQSVVHLEASGGYERLVRRLLEEGGVKALLHNPLKPKRMAQAKGRKAKTDPVDARSLSEWGALLPEGSVRNLERQKLADHQRAIQTLKEISADLKKRLGVPELDVPARELYTSSLLDLEKRIQLSQKALEQRVKESAFSSWYKLLLSVPGLGRVSAVALICELPEDFRERSAAQICSYAGLAPIDDSSGKRQGQARLGRGNFRLKGALYMPALSVMKSQPWAKELYARLRAKGRSHQTAVVAVMRRLLVRAVVVLQRGTPWQVEPQKH